MTVIVEDINARVALAREHVVRGELPSAASNFREALFLVDRHLDTVNNSYLHGRWVSCKEALKEEAATVEAGAKLSTAAQQRTPKAAENAWQARALSQNGSDYSPNGSPVLDSIPAARMRHDEARAEAGSPARLPNAFQPRRVSCTPEFSVHAAMMANNMVSMQPGHQQARRMARTPSEPARAHVKAPFGVSDLQEASPMARQPHAEPARHPHDALHNPMFGRPQEVGTQNAWSHTAADHDPEVWQNCLREPWSKPKAPSFRRESPAPGSRRQSAGLGRDPAAKVDSWRDPKDRPGAKESTPGAGTPGAARLAFDGPDKELADALIRDLHISSPGVAWDDIAGLEDAKRVLQENVILPLLMPDYFQGIRRPVKGVLLFGPPGTGKTMLAKAVATECNTTFFNVSAATLGSKYRGESERMVRALFDLARERSPTVIFFDEIDALCSTRGAAGEHEASRRVKTELLVQIDGIQGDSGAEARKSVMVMAATNCPWDLDEALRRRLEKRIYIPLPEQQSRAKLLMLSMKGVDVGHDVEFDKIAARAAGYSGDDLTNVCRDAALNGMRRKIAGLSPTQIRALRKDDMQEPVHMADFEEALRRINPSVLADVVRHEQWMKKHGAV